MGILGKESIDILADAVEHGAARDYSLVLDPEIAEHARQLAGTLRDKRPDVESLFILAWFMWHRFGALGPKGRVERDIAFQLFARCLIHGDKPVPRTIVRDILPISIDLAVDLLQRGANARKAPLDQAVHAWRRLESVTSDEHPERAMVLANLRVALLMRFGTTRDMADLDEAIIAVRQATQMAATDDPDRVSCLIYLGDTLQMRIEQTDAASDVDEIIEVWREALRTLATDSSDRMMILSRLGGALLMRFARDETQTMVDLDEAVAVYRQAAQAALVGHPGRSRLLSNLTIALRIRAYVTGEATDSEEARAAQEEAAKATRSTWKDWRWWRA